MASLFDRISKAVGDLTKKVEDSGVIDDIKDLVGSDSSSESTAADSAAAPSSPSGSAPSRWQAAVERAGVDPMTLLTPQAVGAAVGLDFDHSYEQLEDEWFGVTWTSKSGGGPYVDARFTHGYTDGSPVDIDGVWSFVTGEAGADQPIDIDSRVEARRDKDYTAYVRTPSHLFYIVSGGLPDDRDTPTVHMAAAKAVVASLLG
ncbi:MAG: hypothetical protein GY720_00210 [bacterium]|nr:hypothetical protein [bacterium]